MGGRTTLRSAHKIWTSIDELVEALVSEYDFEQFVITTNTLIDALGGLVPEVE